MPTTTVGRDWRINNDNRTEFDLRVFCHLNRVCSCVNWFSRASPKGFFNICNFGVKTIEASSPFKYFPIEYTKNCKIDSLILGHRRELRPDILSRFGADPTHVESVCTEAGNKRIPALLTARCRLLCGGVSLPTSPVRNRGV